MPNELLEFALPWLRKGDDMMTHLSGRKITRAIKLTAHVSCTAQKTVRPSQYRVETVMMAFLLLTSVLHLDKTILLLGKASHDDLPAQILPLPPQASHLYHNATMLN